MTRYTVGVKGVSPETEAKLSAFGAVTGSVACLDIYFLEIESPDAAALDNSLTLLREEPYVQNVHTSAIMNSLNA